MARVGMTTRGTVDRRLRGLGRGMDAQLRVGFLGGATYPDGKSVAEIAVIQNDGAPAAGIPPRPFFSDMVAAKKDGWAGSLARLIKNTGNPEKALGLLGQGIANQLKQSIVDTNEPPLKAATIARKGFAKPLIFSGQMLASVDSDVVPK